MSIFDDRGNVRPRRAWTYGCTAALLLFVVLPVSLWAFGVLTSGPKGTGDLTKQCNSAANRAHWSSVFNGLAQQIQADQQNITIAKQAATAPGATHQDQLNLEGVEQNCQTDVAEYNADLDNVLAVVPDGLPNPYSTTICGG